MAPASAWARPVAAPITVPLFRNDRAGSARGRTPHAAMPGGTTAGAPEGAGGALNRHGGMLGGISSGEPVVCRVALKPTSSLPQPQRTVTRAGEPTEIITRGRHDPCLLPRFVPMGEAMMALVLVDHWLRWRAQCGAT